MNRHTAVRTIPTVGRIALFSILSVNFPKYAVVRHWTKGWVTMTIPASVAVRLPMLCR